MTVIDILLIVLILAATALCIFVIVTLKNLMVKIDDMQKDIQKLVDNTIPVLNNLTDVTEKANRIVSEAENYWDEMDHSIKSLKERVHKLTSFTRSDDEENPARDLIKNLRAFFKGLSTFWSEFKRR